MTLAGAVPVFYLHLSIHCVCFEHSKLSATPRGSHLYVLKASTGLDVTVTSGKSRRGSHPRMRSRCARRRCRLIVLPSKSSDLPTEQSRSVAYAVFVLEDLATRVFNNLPAIEERRALHATLGSCGKVWRWRFHHTRNAGGSLCRRSGRRHVGHHCVCNWVRSSGRGVASAFGTEDA